MEPITILAVDDEQINLQIINELVDDIGYRVILAPDGEKALEELAKEKINLILLDINMPGMDGYEVLEKVIDNEHWKTIPVIMITSVDEVNSIVKCLNIGASDYITKPFEPEILKARINNSLEKQKFLATEKELLEKTLSGSIKMLIEILSAVNPLVLGKLTRIRRMVKLVAMKMDVENIWPLEMAAMLSQIGSISVPQDIMDKVTTGKILLPNEISLYNKHVNIAYKIIKNIPRLQEVADIVYYQMKNWDGSGPPIDELSGENIPLGSRIIHVAFDYDLINSIQSNRLRTIDIMRQKTNIYDVSVIDHLEKVVIEENKMEIKNIKILELNYGMIFAEDVTTSKGQKILSRGQEANYAIISRLQNIADRIDIVEPVKVVLPKVEKL